MIEIAIITTVLIPYIYIKIKNYFFYKLKKYKKLDRSIL